jgi:hypothetical protein
LLELVNLTDDSRGLQTLLEINESLVSILNGIWVPVVNEHQVSQVLSQEGYAGRVDRVKGVAVLGMVSRRVSKLLKSLPSSLGLNMLFGFQDLKNTHEKQTNKQAHFATRRNEGLSKKKSFVFLLLLSLPPKSF